MPPAYVNDLSSSRSSAVSRSNVGLGRALRRPARPPNAALPARETATGVFSISCNLGGIVGITLTSVMLGSNPGLNAFRGIFGLYAARAPLDTAIATRLAYAADE